jgi:hypothetical protein
MHISPRPPTSDTSSEDNPASVRDWRTIAVNDATDLPGLPETEDLQRLLQYWNVQRSARPFPRRQDVDPLDFWFMLDRVTLIEVHEGPQRYRLRLVGSFWQRLVGFEATGMWLEDWPHPNQRKLTEAAYERLLAGRTPRFTRRDTVLDYQTLNYEIMLLPLSEDGSRITMIMAGIGQN